MAKAKIILICGKSSVGKDTLVKEMFSLSNSGAIGGLAVNSIGLQRAPTFTTRPMRKGEVDGVDYHFITVQDIRKAQGNNKLIELRHCDTIVGGKKTTWYYGMLDIGQFEDNGNYIVVVTPEAVVNYKYHFGDENVLVVGITVPEVVRFNRAVARETLQPTPNCTELCRRWLADEKDFERFKPDVEIENIDLATAAAELYGKIYVFANK